jgi:DNA-binding NarL/FixJ family response regulator
MGDIMGDRESIRVAVVDDNDRLRLGLTVFLETFDNIELAGEAETGVEAIELCEEQKPDIILMDVKMPQMDGITATQIISRQYPEIGIIILTSATDSQVIEKALHAGARMCLLKNVTVEELYETIVDVYDAIHESSTD